MVDTSESIRQSAEVTVSFRFAEFMGHKTVVEPPAVPAPTDRTVTGPPEAGPAPQPRLTPRQEYIAGVCRECDDNLICPQAYAEGCSPLRTSLGAMEHQPQAVDANHTP
jgi:hypothetical protein